MWDPLGLEEVTERQRRSFKGSFFFFKGSLRVCLRVPIKGSIEIASI